jgi:hypothetical protein
MVRVVISSRASAMTPKTILEATSYSTKLCGRFQELDNAAEGELSDD